jgi:hypothetical protein
MASASLAVGEKLSVTTAIIGLLAVGGKTIDALWDLNTPANKANSIFAVALQEIKQCRSTVHILYKTLSLVESAQLPFPERGVWIEADHLIATLTDTVLAVSDLQTLCKTLSLERQGIVTPPPENGSPDHSPPSYERRISGLCSRIRWHNLSMTMMMTILKWYVLALSSSSYPKVSLASHPWQSSALHLVHMPRKPLREYNG